MHKKQYSTVIYIGRFQPFHNAHLAMLNKAAELANQVIVIVGSANQPRTPKNPFTAEERIDIIKWAVGRESCYRFESIEDTVYNNTEWCVNVQEIVSRYTSISDKIAVIGHKKDNSSDYLDMFPQWDFIDQPLLEPLHATDIRDAYFEVNKNTDWSVDTLPKHIKLFLSQNDLVEVYSKFLELYVEPGNPTLPKKDIDWIRTVVPDETLAFLEKFKLTPDYKKLVAEKEFLVKCKLPYAFLPYLPIFVTADMCTFQNGHVLMGHRKSEPGKGLLAFPGGYVNAKTDNSVLHAAVREFYEETRAKVPEKVLRGNIVAEKVFDAVDRSERGRIITHAYKVQLPDGEFPKVRGSDDLASARWIPISEVKRVQCFEDHYDILKYFLGVGN